MVLCRRGVQPLVDPLQIAQRLIELAVHLVEGVGEAHELIVGVAARAE